MRLAGVEPTTYSFGGCRSIQLSYRRKGMAILSVFDNDCKGYVNMKRRTFLKMASALPLFNIGCAGFGHSRAHKIAHGAKIRLALIGCGSRMGHSVRYGILNEFHDEEIVCICDPDPANRKKVLNTIFARNPSIDVSKIRQYFDYRQMFEKEAGSLDAAVIATPNHHHALAAVLAMNKGLHVYVEKPMALTVEEVVMMERAQRASGAVLQVGNQGHSSEGMRRFVEFVKAGVFGQIREVWCYCDRINAMSYRPPAAPPPSGMDWDLWCGPAKICDYYKGTEDHQGMHPHDWHSWIGYGNGSIGNMGTHIMDAAFWALDLCKTSPRSVVASDVKWGAEGSWSLRTHVRWRFPEHGDFAPVDLHWYDGIVDGVSMTKKYVDMIGCCRKREYQFMPPVIEEVEKKYNAHLSALGSVFIGEKGCAYIGTWGESLQVFLDDMKKGTLSSVPKTLPREKRMTHGADWLRAIRDRSRPCGCNIKYSAPLAKTVLLGNVAPLAGAGNELEWNGSRITNNEAANRYLATGYRRGWEIEA